MLTIEGPRRQVLMQGSDEPVRLDGRQEGWAVRCGILHAIAHRRRVVDVIVA
jgi:hypothetical protein